MSCPHNSEDSNSFQEYFGGDLHLDTVEESEFTNINCTHSSQKISDENLHPHTKGGLELTEISCTSSSQKISEETLYLDIAGRAELTDISCALLSQNSSGKNLHLNTTGGSELTNISYLKYIIYNIILLGEIIKREIVTQKKIILDYLPFTRFRSTFIKDVKNSIETEIQIYDKQFKMICRHIKLLKDLNIASFRKFLEKLKFHQKVCDNKITKLKKVKFEFLSQSIDLLVKNKKLYKGLKRILQGQTVTYDEYVDRINTHAKLSCEVANLFKLHTEICSSGVERHLWYSNICSELGILLQNKTTKIPSLAEQLSRHATQFRNDSDVLKYHADILLLHKTQSNSHNKMFIDFENTFITVAKMINKLKDMQRIMRF